MVAAIAVGACVAVAYVARRGDAGGVSELVRMRADLTLLSDQLASQAATLSRRLEGIDSRLVHTQTANQDLARGIFDTLGQVKEATRTVAAQAREFVGLQDLLRPPKARGGIGEAMLTELLRQILPPRAYAVQHRFRSGATVDAVVHLGGRLVCIDSKFPLSNYRRMCDAADDVERGHAERAFAADVDRHVRDIAARYIAPDEKTFDFAVMYVPAEGVYGEVLRLSHRRRPLFEVAMEARVVPMSPLTMYGYLQTVLYGLKCLSIEERAEAILGFCGRLEQDVQRFAADYDTLGRHITNARSKYEDGARSLDRLQARLERVVGPGDDDERPTLEAVAD